MNRRELISMPLAGFAGTPLTACANTGATAVPVDDGIQSLRPGFFVRLRGDSSEFEAFFGLTLNDKASSPVVLRPGSAILVNGVRLKQDTGPKSSTYAAYIPRAKRLKFEIVRHPHQHTIVEVDFAAFEARPINVPWRYPDPLQLKIDNAIGITPESVQDAVAAHVVLGELSIHKFDMPEGVRLLMSDSTLGMELIPSPNTRPTRSHEATLRIWRSQRLAMRKLTNHYHAGWILMTHILPDMPFRIST